jgi:hypothetical protein
LLRVPRPLLFNVDEIEFVDDRMRLKPTANVMEAYRIFFDRYADAFSWGGGGRARNMQFVAALDSLPADVRDVLIEDFGFENLLEGDSASRAQRRFVESGAIRIDDRRYIVPLIELANRGTAGLAYEFTVEDVQVQGMPQGEIFVSQGAHDTLSMFQVFGFASPEPGAFSLPLRVPTKPTGMFIGRETSRTLKRGSDWVPQMNEGEDHYALSYLMTGHRKFPRLSRGIFRLLAREAGLNNADEAFDSILSFNWTQYLKLLEVLEPHEGAMIATLRKVARYQLECMSHCVGSREPSSDTQTSKHDVAEHPAQQLWDITIQ